MKIHRFNIAAMSMFEDASKEQLIFIKPIAARLTRLYHVPEKFRTTHLIQVLNTLCTCQRNGVYYFRLRDKEEEDVFMDTLAHMGLIPFSIKPDGEKLN